MLGLYQTYAKQHDLEHSHVKFRIEGQQAFALVRAGLGLFCDDDEEMVHGFFLVLDFAKHCICLLDRNIITFIIEIPFADLRDISDETVDTKHGLKNTIKVTTKE